MHANAACSRAVRAAIFQVLTIDFEISVVLLIASHNLLLSVLTYECFYSEWLVLTDNQCFLWPILVLNCNYQINLSIDTWYHLYLNYGELVYHQSMWTFVAKLPNWFFRLDTICTDIHLLVTNDCFDPLWSFYLPWLNILCLWFFLHLVNLHAALVIMWIGLPGSS